MENMRVCWHCLLGIESREGKQATLLHPIDEDNHETKCDWCKKDADEGGFDTLYELI